MNKARFLAGFVGLLAASAACSKDDPPPIPAPEAPAAAEATSAPSVAPAPVASASAPAAALASAPVPAPASGQSPSPSRAHASSDGGSPACGDNPLPPCPLKAWMKANAAPASIAEDFDGLATAFDTIATFAPAGYPNWSSIAHDGADAAHAQSLDGAKAACRGCHSQYKDKYKKEMRDRPI